MKTDEVKYPTGPNDLVHSFASTFEDYGNGGGLTKREYFAAMAMQGFCANSRYFDNWTADGHAKASVEHADALIAELNKDSK